MCVCECAFVWSPNTTLDCRCEDMKTVIYELDVISLMQYIWNMIMLFSGILMSEVSLSCWSYGRDLHTKSVL